MSVSLLGAISGGTPNSRLVAAFLLCVFWNVHANSINDYTDREIDEINLPGSADRPLVAGSVTEEQFWFTHILSAALCLALSTAFGIAGIALTLLLLGIDYVYSLKPIRLTDRSIASPFTLALAYSLFPFSLGVLSTNTQHFKIGLFMALFCALGARMLLKDFRDTAGDERFGKRTFLLRYGAPATCLASASGWAASIALINVVAFPGHPVLIATSVIALIYMLGLLRQLANKTAMQSQLQLVNKIALGGHAMMLILIIFLIND